MLEEHLKTAAATYTSPTIQNQLISICGDYIRDCIIKQIGHQVCSVIADEVTDSSNLEEQLSLVLR